MVAAAVVVVVALLVLLLLLLVARVPLPDTGANHKGGGYCWLLWEGDTMAGWKV